MVEGSHLSSPMMRTVHCFMYSYMIVLKSRHVEKPRSPSLYGRMNLADVCLPRCPSKIARSTR